MSTTLTDFYLNSRSDVIAYQTLELSHPDFSKVYRFVRNAMFDVEVVLETGEDATFDYSPLEIRENTTKEDLDYSVDITLGELGAILPAEFDVVAKADGFLVKPVLIFRTYRSDTLLKPITGPLKLEVTSFSTDGVSFSFRAETALLNLHKTGEKYTIERFPMLQSFK